jgi:hypothetical protein
MLDAISSQVQADNAVQSPRAELIAYLESPLEPNITDIVRWWGVSGSIIIHGLY